MFLRQSTAQVIKVGPFLDDTDGKTAETALTLTNTDFRLSKDGGNFASSSTGSGTHDELGVYNKTLSTTDTNTVGELVVHVHESGALPVTHRYWVLEEAVYDAYFGASAAGYVSSQVAASVTGAVGSVTGAVGSVTGNVGGNVQGALVGNVQGDVEGNVDGSVASVTARVTANVDQIDGASFASHTAGYVPAEVTSGLDSVSFTVTDSGFVPTTTQFKIDTSPFNDDIPIGRAIYWDDAGSDLYGHMTICIDWDGTTQIVTVREMPAAPASADTGKWL